METNDDLLEAPNRLETFKAFPSKDVFSFKCAAEEGFYYNKVNNTVCCYYCSLSISNINTILNIKNIHNKFSTRCPTVFDYSTNKRIKKNSNPLEVQKRFIFFLKKKVANKSIEMDRLIEKNKELVCNKEKEIEELKSNMLCKVCFSNEMNIILFPCRHLLLCEECVVKIEQKCPKCKASIENNFKVFL